MADIHVYEYETFAHEHGVPIAPDESTLTYTRKTSAGSAQSVTLGASTRYVEVWGDGEWGYDLSSTADANSPLMPANVVKPLGDNPASTWLAGRTLSLYAAS